MACACKTTREKKEKIYKNADGTIKPRGFKFYINWFYRYIFLSRIFMPILLLIICGLVVPFLLIISIISQIIIGETKIVLPKKLGLKMKKIHGK